MVSPSDVNKPKVSIIVPVYNVRQYITEALDSIINQTYKNLEIIVVNDGSTDGSEIICQEYAQKDSRIKLINRKNGGLSAARNTGLDTMTVEYVAFLDSDDIFLPETIEKSLNIMLSEDVDCVAFRRIVFKTTMNRKRKVVNNRKNNVIKPHGKFTGEEALKLIVNRKLSPLVWTKISKREIWEDLRFPENHVYEDLYIIFKMIEKIKKIYMMNDSLILYRNRKGSISSTYSIKNTKDFINSYSVFQNFVEANIPKIFDAEQLQNVRKRIFVDLLLYYIKVLSVYYSEKESVLNMLREYLKNQKEINNIEHYNAEIKYSYYLMSNHSKLLSVSFPIIFKIYKFIKAILLR